MSLRSDMSNCLFTEWLSGANDEEENTNVNRTAF
jgi:hypothetical protein